MLGRFANAVRLSTGDVLIASGEEETGATASSGFYPSGAAPVITSRSRRTSNDVPRSWDVTASRLTPAFPSSFRC